MMFRQKRDSLLWEAFAAHINSLLLSSARFTNSASTVYLPKASDAAEANLSPVIWCYPQYLVLLGLWETDAPHRLGHRITLVS
ncbi:protein of unknown function (plasmid) [Cupriavidus taiwanensis]|uniref:Uncharacterized protein n=1 Tax=Cupriavidus taiwanensis TaxID=164546 RepID=A0A375IPF9_9BURK|nr:protein of unknown function [Cupriavidus taiwanensis]